MIRFINQEQGKDTEFAIRSEADFQAEDERGSFYKNFYRNEKMQRIYLGHKKMPMIYSDPIFRNLVSIHLLSAFSDNQDQKYLTEGCQKPFIPAHGVCLAYQTHRALSSYITKSGRILVIFNMVEPTSSLTPDHFHQPLYTHQYPTLNITPLNLISRIPRRGSDSKPAFIQCGWHAKFGAIFGLSLPEITPYSTTYRNLVPHYLNIKMVEMGAEELITRILKSKEID